MMKKLILLFFVCWLAIMDASAVYAPPIRTKDPTLLMIIDVTFFIGLIFAIYIIVGNKLEDDKFKDEQEKSNQNKVRFSKKPKPVNEKFKKYEIYTSKNFKKKK
ncbi:hypothetical protein A9G11_03560 [Gilliamella sp. wkB108]|uniref:hypothetical protein n=1 Tax=Gilliamella sp. wkB108 TaxID=3120256 RepID=UPI00080E0FFB|nr:hypothetical protein [Gilliamella apicola]OCG24743.1 hypothetical protein A9G11_03560 [Gilliamella apicola]